MKNILEIIGILFMYVVIPVIMICIITAEVTGYINENKLYS